MSSWRALPNVAQAVYINGCGVTHKFACRQVSCIIYIVIRDSRFDGCTNTLLRTSVNPKIPVVDCTDSKYTLPISFCDSINTKPTSHVSFFYSKSPHDIQYPDTVAFFRNMAPQTKLIVAIRHPVLYFESFFVSNTFVRACFRWPVLCCHPKMKKSLTISCALHV